ncbi:MAG: hypothetical protein K2Y56_24195 [Methylobacterium sp.]|uniref:hypothetical protein n=1 Tax=Methylobacterium sp. TaxID=409 RepID=UPI0025EFBC5B|nr:hypothetical protein [Methylobacterium sp.]MBX9934580.1 hypothetical protein [Methylobacterium sp.]
MASPTPQQAKDELELIYTEVGRALSIWAGVESTHAHVFHLASGSKFIDVSFSVLDAVKSFQARNKLVDDAIKTAVKLQCRYLSPEDANELKLILTRWLKLKKCLDEEGRARNDFAHKVAMTRFDSSLDADQCAAGVPMLSLPFGHPKFPTDFKTAVNNGITATQIRARSDQFRKIGQELSDLQQDWLNISTGSARPPPLERRQIKNPQLNII